MDDPRRLSPMDSYIGSRIRIARKIGSLSQQGLAERLGVTFQQVQKYEKGTNRISASRLHHLASVIDVPVSFFFPEPAAGADDNIPSQSSETMQLGRSLSPQDLDAAVFLRRIEDENIRRRALSLLKALADSSK